MTAPVFLMTAPAFQMTAAAWPRGLRTTRRAMVLVTPGRVVRKRKTTIFEAAIKTALHLYTGDQEGTEAARRRRLALLVHPRPSAGIDLSQGRNVMGTEATSHPTAALAVAKDNAPGVISRANIMYVAILAAIATFSATPITMAAFLLLIEAAQTAQTASASRAKGLAAVRNTKITPLWTAMNLLLVYVQGLVDQVDHQSGVALINQAGLVVGGVAGHVKKLFVATLDTTANVVHLVLNAKAFTGATHKRVTFHWQISSDGKTWTSLPSTPYAKTSLPSPGPGSYLFRAAATVGQTVLDWTPPIPLTIH